MTALYLDHSRIALELQGQSLRIYRNEQFQRSIPIGLVDHIVCRASVGIHTSLLANLASQGIGLTFFGGRYGKHSAHLGGGGTQDVNRRLAQYQIHLDPRQRLQWSVRLVSHKIAQQRRFLQKARRQRLDLRLSLTRALDSLNTQIDTLRQQPPTRIDSLRGIEGSAARSYFQGYASLMPQVFGFAGRQRRPPPDPVNVLLSLGYTLLFADVQHAIESVGLDPWLGIYHEQYHGRPALACDLIEPFRTSVDTIVWYMLAKKILREHHFSTTDQGCMLEKEGRALFYPEYERLARTLRPLLRRIVLQVARDMQTRIQANRPQPLLLDDEDELPFDTVNQMPDWKP